MAETRFLFISALLVSVILAVGLAQVAFAFKSEEFRKCHQTPFCKEARDRKVGSSDIEVRDIELKDGEVWAKLYFNESTSALILRTVVYEGGIVRFKIDEEPSLGKKKRFEVPDVLEKDLDDKKLWLQRVTEEDGATVFFLTSGHEVVLQPNPFQIYVRKGSEKLVSFNGKGLFHFEQLREKQEGEDWEERFRTHHDSRPYGPQSVSFDVSFHGADHVYGIPEHATNLSLRATRGPEISSEPYRLFNLDVFEYLEDSPFGLYGSVPFMLSHTKGRTTGFFWLNSAEMLIDVLAQGWEGWDPKEKAIDTHWMSESGIIDAFMFIGPQPKDVVKQYTTVTGKMAMPPLFATAYHQCRWNYRDEADVANVDSKFDEYDIPYDVIWLDIEHTDGKKYFTWDPVLFPNPKEMQAKIADKGRHMVTIVDPHIKRDDNFHLHKEATAKGYYVKDAHGKDYDGWCWPGSSSYLDVLNPEIRSWWADKFSFSSYAGSTPIVHIWNDMNEPSVFNGPEATMPRDNKHYGGYEHRDVHNAYGYYFHMASTEGLLRRSKGKERPFVLSRAFFAGTQKVGPVWTGDNTADWDHVRVSIPMVVTLGLTGNAFTGADVGGFFGNPNAELLTRWYQMGAFYPFFRAHAHLDTKRREPWLFGEPYTSLIREAVHMRYRFLPHYYTLFREASATGVPIMRSLWMEYPDDEITFALEDEFLIGDSLLVHGVYSEGASMETVYLPGMDTWYDIKTGAPYAGGKHYNLPVSLESILVFQKGGSIIPQKERFRRSSSQMENDPYTLVVALNSTYEAEGELFIDDGKSFDFETKGAFVHRRFTFSGGRISSSAVGAGGKGNEFSTSCVVERIVILGLRPKDFASTKRALVEFENRELDIETGPVILRPGVKMNAVIVRLPNVPISGDWSIKVL